MNKKYFEALSDTKCTDCKRYILRTSRKLHSDIVLNIGIILFLINLIIAIIPFLGVAYRKYLIWNFIVCIIGSVIYHYTNKDTVISYNPEEYCPVCGVRPPILEDEIDITYKIDMVNELLDEINYLFKDISNIQLRHEFILDSIMICDIIDNSMFDNNINKLLEDCKEIEQSLDDVSIINEKIERRLNNINNYNDIAPHDTDANLDEILVYLKKAKKILRNIDSIHKENQPIFDELNCYV